MLNEKSSITIRDAFPRSCFEEERRQKVKRKRKKKCGKTILLPCANRTLIIDNENWIAIGDSIDWFNRSVKQKHKCNQQQLHIWIHLHFGLTSLPGLFDCVGLPSSRSYCCKVFFAFFSRELRHTVECSDGVWTQIKGWEISSPSPFIRHVCVCVCVCVQVWCNI